MIIAHGVHYLTQKKALHVRGVAADPCAMSNPSTLGVIPASRSKLSNMNSGRNFFAGLSFAVNSGTVSPLLGSWRITKILLKLALVRSIFPFLWRIVFLVHGLITDQDGRILSAAPFCLFCKLSGLNFSFK